MKKIWEHLKSWYSLLVGLNITARYFFSPIETVQYPREVVDPVILKSYRGPLELIAKEDEPSLSKCISCQMCAKACPSNCISIIKSSDSKAPIDWRYDFTLCCLCGSCVEVCPADAIRFSHNVYLASTSKEDLHMDLLAKLRIKASKMEAKNAD